MSRCNHKDTRFVRLRAQKSPHQAARAFKTTKLGAGGQCRLVVGNNDRLRLLRGGNAATCNAANHDGVGFAF